MINIQYESGKVRHVAPISAGSVWKKELMKHDYILLKFSTPEPVGFQKGDYIETPHGRYEMVEKVFPTHNKSTGGYDYELTFEAPYYKWRNNILFYDRGKNKEASWSLTRTPDAHLGIILSNLANLGYTYNGREYTFSIGQSVDMSAKLISYNNVSILDALTTIAQTWDAEWWVEDNCIHLGKCEYPGMVDFAMDQNVSHMSRSSGNDNFATRIYAFGSTRNIPRNYRSSEENVVVGGIVQKRLMLPVGNDYVDAPGTSPADVVESVVVFDDVYPRRVGTLSAVTTKEYTDKIEQEDGTTTTEKWIAYRFTDSGITFSTAYLLDDQELRLTFTSGALNGMDFGVLWDEKDRVFELVRNEDYGVALPSPAFQPKPGDNYILYGFDTSFIDKDGQSYITAAEKELLQRATEYVRKSKEDPSVYDCTMNMTSDAKYDDLNVGDPVRLLNPVYFDEGGRQSRVYAFEKHLDGSQVTYTVGDSAKYSRLAKVENEIKEIMYDGNVYSGSGGGVYVIGKYDNTKVSDRNVFSARRSMIEFLSAKYPSTAQRTVTFEEGIHLGDYVKGAKGAGIYEDEQGNWHLDTDFVNIRKKLTAEELEIQTTSHVGGKLMCTAASMVCAQVEEYDDYWRCYFKQKDEKGRELEQQFRADDLAYVQTFNLKENEDGTLSNRFLWRLVVGVGKDYIDLSKADCLKGSGSPLAGDTIVQLGNKTEPSRQNAIIQSSVGDGAPYLRVYKGIKTYAYPVPKIDLNPDETHISAHSITLESTGKDVQETLDDLAGNVEAVKKQNDQMWVLWFGSEIPTLENFPASDWESDELKGEHVQDILVVDNPQDDTMNGRAWRFHKAEDGSFCWTEITDKYLIKALSIAVEGRDNARQKHRNFVKQELTDDDVYEVGDTWSNVTYDKDGVKYENDNLVAISDKAKGEKFEIRHWQPVSAATSSRLEIMENSIKAWVEGEFSSAGFEAGDTFSSLFATALDEKDVVTQAEIKTFITEDDANNLISNATIIADQIRLEGLTTINENTIIHTDGSFEAVRGKFSGEVNATSGIFKNVLVEGSIRSPFKKVDSFGVGYDNVIIPQGGGGGWTTSFSLPWGIENSGRKLTVLNFTPETGAQANASASTLPGKYIYEHGRAKESLVVKANSAVELIGVGSGNTFWGWIVLSRVYFGVNNTDSTFGGKPADILAMGEVAYRTTNGPCVVKSWTYNNEPVTASRVDKGQYYINLYGSVGFADDNFIVFTTATSGSEGRETHPCKATVMKKSKLHLLIHTSDDASENDASFNFLILNPNTW